MYGGEVIPVNTDYPWVILLIIHVGAHEDKICSGSVIADRWVLTAAHCVQNGETASPRVTTVNVYRAARKFVRYQARGIFVHPSYLPPFNDEQSDLALVSTIKKIKVPLGLLSTKNYYPNVTCTILGFGQRDARSPPSVMPLLAKMEVNMAPEEACRRMQENKTNVLCLMAVRGVGPCVGDSGSPLVCGGRIAGVCSRGLFTKGSQTACGQAPLSLVLYHLVDLRWVKDTIGSMSASSGAAKNMAGPLALLGLMLLSTWRCPT